MPCSLFASPCRTRTGEERTKRNRTRQARKGLFPMFLNPCLARHARIHDHVDAQRSRRHPPSIPSARPGLNIRPGSSWKLHLASASAASVSPSVSVSGCVPRYAPAPASRLHLRRLQSASASATAVPLSCPGGVLSTGPPYPPRRCISVPSLVVGYSTD